MSIPVTLIEQQLSQTLAGIRGAGGNSAQREQFKDQYETDPIILVGGIAGSSYAQTKLISDIAGGLTLQWLPMPGSSVLSAQVATYPFANQAVAANAIIQQPLRVSMIAICPADPSTVGYLGKNKAFTQLAQSLNRHNNLGGLYSVWTPSYTYTNCLLVDVLDVSDGRSHQAQYQWRFDFMQPLLTLEAATEAMNSLMGKLNSGVPVLNPAWSSPDNGNISGGQVNNSTGLIAPSALQ